eukprot:TRINITY_DN879_c0_g1_i1.p2 TRINITY_DN879_c0_g1~~TRINITY_DN879_c0_g1_i1.p2  ORF type:complete len:131 (+),score=21.23 TRINITY_DN879_c0_g1_i1:500-892(+)
MGYKFECMCAACSVRSVLGDTRRHVLKLIRDQLPSVAHKNCEAVIVLVELAASIMEAEKLRLPTLLSGFYYDALQTCAAYGREGDVRKYAQKAWTAIKIAEGENSQESKRMKKFANNPRSHYAWGAMLIM